MGRKLIGRQLANYQLIRIITETYCNKYLLAPGPIFNHFPISFIWSRCTSSIFQFIPLQWYFRCTSFVFPLYLLHIPIIFPLCFLHISFVFPLQFLVFLRFWQRRSFFAFRSMISMLQPRIMLWKKKEFKILC